MAREVALDNAAGVDVADEKMHVGSDSKDDRPRSKVFRCLNIIIRVVGVLCCLYLFLVGIELMGTAFKVLGGKGAGKMFRNIPNGLAALMIGVLATVMVQSSSTSTSVVVALVAAGQLQVRPSIPIIMGANIGTTVTNTIVSMGQAGDRVELERAFGGATVHDFFNLMSVAILFPVEQLFHPIEAISAGIAGAVIGKDKCENCDFESPIDIIVKPATKLIVDADKSVIYALSLGAPTAEPGTVTVSSNCTSSGRTGSQAVCGEQQFWCLEKTASKTWTKIHTHKLPSFKKSPRWTCEGKGIEGAASLCESCTAPGCGSVCVLDAELFFEEEVQNGDTIKSGLLNFPNSELGGSLALVAALLIMMMGLMGFVKVMHSLLLTKAKKVLMRSTNLPGVVSILIGTAVTIVVQSSSVTTSALTPLVGLGVIELKNMFPLTLGANIGTCSTAVIAAFATMDLGGMTIAFCHLTFNLIGILIFYPIPFLRRIPLYEASLAGMYASVYRLFPLAYIVFVYVAVPLAALALGFLFQASTAGGIVVLGVVVMALAGLVYWWNWMGGCYKLLSREQRLETIFGRTLEGMEGLPSEKSGKMDGPDSDSPDESHDEGDAEAGLRQQA